MELNIKREKCKRSFNRTGVSSIGEIPESEIHSIVDKVELVANNFKFKKCFKKIMCLYFLILILVVAGCAIKHHMRARHMMMMERSRFDHRGPGHMMQGRPGMPMHPPQPMGNGNMPPPMGPGAERPPQGASQPPPMDAPWPRPFRGERPPRGDEQGWRNRHHKRGGCHKHQQNPEGPIPEGNPNTSPQPMPPVEAPATESQNSDSPSEKKEHTRRILQQPNPAPEPKPSPNPESVPNQETQPTTTQTSQPPVPQKPTGQPMPPPPPEMNRPHHGPNGMRHKRHRRRPEHGRWPQKGHWRGWRRHHRGHFFVRFIIFFLVIPMLICLGFRCAKKRAFKRVQRLLEIENKSFRARYGFEWSINKNLTCLTLKSLGGAHVGYPTQPVYPHPHLERTPFCHQHVEAPLFTEQVPLTSARHQGYERVSLDDSNICYR